MNANLQIYGAKGTKSYYGLKLGLSSTDKTRQRGGIIKSVISYDPKSVISCKAKQSFSGK